ncbi:creatinine amidohydrolase [Azospirillaceae bacterium]
MAGRFVGDVSPEQAWQGLVADPKAVLVDVRTKPEWQYVGVPDMSSLNRSLIKVEWQVYPSMEKNRAFSSEIVAKGVKIDQPVFIICRSGIRSKAAAELLAGLGYVTYNVADGFEGQIDAAGHRGVSGGWKIAGLPWKQT